VRGNGKVAGFFYKFKNFMWVFSGGIEYACQSFVMMMMMQKKVKI
jgi:hypothetical protein